jgi:uncharacterized membrane protein YiaA
MSQRDLLEDDEDERAAAPLATTPKRLLNFRAALGLYGALAVLSLLTLQGKFLIFMLIVLGAIAVLTYTHHLREKLEEEKTDD